jgi:hypothetical protein
MVAVPSKLAHHRWAFLLLDFCSLFWYNYTMTIEQLIKILQQHDPKLPVLLSGYEGGVYEPHGKLIRQVLVAKDVNEEWYYGPHEIVYPEFNNDYPNHEKFQGLIIT